MDLKELYQDIILEHGKSPKNLGKCQGYNHDAKGYNPLCGDKVHVYLKLDNIKKIKLLTPHFLKNMKPELCQQLKLLHSMSQ